MTETHMQQPHRPPAEAAEDSPRHLFLDLEDTVIEPVPDGWMNARFINIPKVKAFIEQWNPVGVHLFSFAVWNEQQLRGFTNHVQPHLEKYLGRELYLTPTVDDDILPACCAVKGLSIDRVDFSDMSDFWSKQDSFKHYVRHKFGDVRARGGLQVVLLDDAVFHERFEWPGLGIRGEILNIDEMEA